MEKHTFIELIEKYKPIIDGRGREIAQNAEISYATYSNYVKGIASDPVIRARIIEECEKVAQDIKAKIEEIV